LGLKQTTKGGWGGNRESPKRCRSWRRGVRLESITSEDWEALKNKKILKRGVVLGELTRWESGHSKRKRGKTKLVLLSRWRTVEGRSTGRPPSVLYSRYSGGAGGGQHLDVAVPLREKKGEAYQELRLYRSRRQRERVYSKWGCSHQPE